MLSGNELRPSPQLPRRPALRHQISLKRVPELDDVEQCKDSFNKHLHFTVGKDRNGVPQHCGAGHGRV